MSIVDLSGAIDLHIHSNPSLFNRVGSDMDMAEHARDNQLAGILLKITLNPPWAVRHWPMKRLRERRFSAGWF